jgi:hypothetical protein
MATRRRDSEEATGLLTARSSEADAAKGHDKDEALHSYHGGAYIITLVLGLGLLLPWNVVLNAYVEAATATCTAMQNRVAAAPPVAWPCLPRS